MTDPRAANLLPARSGFRDWPPGIGPWRADLDVDAAPRILLIDAARESAAALERISGEVGALVHHADTAADALRYIYKFYYDAVVVDLELGGKTPLALLEQVRAVQSTAGVLLSGDLRQRLPEGFSLGGNLLGSFRKPWDTQEVTTALRRAFELSRTRRTPRPALPAARAGFERVLLLGGRAEYRRIERMARSWFGPGGLVHATSLEEGLLLLNQHGVDLVLTELYLPDACGLDSVVRIRRVSVQTPIVVLLASDDAALVEQVLQAGAQDVLLAPELERRGLYRALWCARHRQRAQLHLQHGALHDELTSLAKRTLLHQRITNALARSRRIGNTFAVMYIDLDHFKRINDTYGHDIGDAVLVAVSQRLRSAVREYDTVARLGGDEFAILLDSLDGAAEAEIVAQRVLAALVPPVRVDQCELDVKASMGISVFPDGGGVADDLLRSADQAMYSAKRAGRNTYSVAPPSSPSGLAPAVPPSSPQCSVPPACPAPVSSIPASSMPACSRPPSTPPARSSLAPLQTAPRTASAAAARSGVTPPVRSSSSVPPARLASR